MEALTPRGRAPDRGPCHCISCRGTECGCNNEEGLYCSPELGLYLLTWLEGWTDMLLDRTRVIDLFTPAISYTFEFVVYT